MASDLNVKDNHLAFIYDFSVPFDNNPSERDLRIIKIKTKISGGFKNINSAEAYCNAISIIKTSLKRKINPFESIKAIFNNEVLFANYKEQFLIITLYFCML